MGIQKRHLSSRQLNSKSVIRICNADFLIVSITSASGIEVNDVYSKTSVYSEVFSDQPALNCDW